MDSSPAPVTVVIPCRNMAPFLPRALDAAFGQTRPPEAVIVVDDGSTDDLDGALAPYGTRVRRLAGPGQGSAIARNLAILSSTSPFLAFLDADDYWEPTHLERALAAFEDPTVGLTCSNWRHEVDGVRGEPLFGSFYSAMASGRVFSSLLRENWILTSSVVVRRQALSHSGLFDPTLIGAQDYELWLRLAKVTDFASLHAPLAVKKGHGGNITASPKYAYHLARVWTTIRGRYVDLPREDRAYVRNRESEALLGAGLQAIRDDDPSRARGYLGRHLRLQPTSVKGWLALVASGLPTPIVRGLRRLKGGGS